MQENADELAVLESLDNGKPFSIARAVDVPAVRHAALEHRHAAYVNKALFNVIVPSQEGT